MVESPGAAFNHFARELLERAAKAKAALAGVKYEKWTHAMPFRGDGPDPSSCSAVAREIGVHRSHWAASVKGVKSPTHRTIVKWLTAWRDGGNDEIELVITADGVEPRVRKKE